MKQASTTAPPRHLSKRSRAFYRGVASDYLLSGHQFELLRRVCEAMDRADQARELIDTEGLTVRDRYGQAKAHPAVAIERDARLALARLLRELNLEPPPDDPRPRSFAY